MKNNTWIVVPNQNVIRCKWMYRLKYNPEGSILNGLKLDWWLRGFIKI